MTKAVLLDIDGTVVDSNDAHARAWEEAMRAYGFPVSFRRVRPLIGMGGDKLLPTLIGVESDSKIGKEIADCRKRLFKRFLSDLRPTPGASALLAQLHADGIVLTVATSAEEDEVSTLLEIAGATPYIDHITSSGDVDQSKPDPDIVHAALGKSGVEPSEAVMLGDTPYDIEAATTADVTIVAVRCGGWWSDADLAGAAAIYDDPEALLQALDNSPIQRSQVTRT